MGERKRFTKVLGKGTVREKHTVNGKPRYTKANVNSLPKSPGKVNVNLLRRAAMGGKWYLSSQQLLGQYGAESNNSSSGATGFTPTSVEL